MRAGKIAVGALLVSTVTWAAGGEHTQGTLFAGQGVDWQRTATATQAVVSISMPTGAPWPPQGAFTMNAANVKIIACSADTNLHAWCLVQAIPTAPVPETQLCGRWLSEQPVLLLHAFRGQVGLDGDFEFASPFLIFVFNLPDFVTFTCGSNLWAPSEGDWDSMGALGKCMQWPITTGGFGFGPTAASALEFQACIRMARADYCGDGVSHTKDGTLIDPYRIKELPTRDLRPGFVFEANWDEKGAICVVHARYASLGPDCRDRFPIRIGINRPADKVTPGKGQLGTEYHCRKPGFRKGCGKVKWKDQEESNVCFENYDAWARLNTGLLFDDSLIQP